MFFEIAKIIDQIYDRPEAEVFRTPVDWERLNLPQYPILIKKPMDLGTALSKYHEGIYEDESELVSDIRQVWINCMIFNQGGSELYNLGDYFADYFENELRIKRKQRHLRATDIDAIPSQTEKKKLDRLLLNADSETLGIIVNYLSKHSQQALTKLPEINDMIEINIDAIPPRVFKEILSIVDNSTTQSYKKVRRL